VVDVSFTMLNALRALAKNQNVGQAADELHITQSGLTQSVIALEKRIGTKLVEHTRQGLSLTKAGDTFSADIRDPLAAFSAACTSIFGFGATEQTVKVAFAIATEHQLIEPLRKRCEGTGLQLSLRRMWTADIPEAVEAGDIDIGFSRHPRVWGQQLRVETLWVSDLVATVPLTHRLADRAEISITELADETLAILPRRLSPGTYDLIESACLRAGFVPKFAKMSGASGLTGLYSLDQSYIGLSPRLSPDDVPATARPIPLTESFKIGLHVITRYASAQQGPVSQLLSIARAIADERERTESDAVDRQQSAAG
jgi:DNA-binding transcriptional LysR family regulator